MKERIIPRWIIYICMVISSLGVIQIVVGNLSWGVSLEKNSAIVLVLISSGIIVIDRLKLLSPSSPR